MPMTTVPPIDSVLTTRMRPVYEAHRSVDLALERAWRESGETNWVALRAQSDNATECAYKLMKMGADRKLLRQAVAEDFRSFSDYHLGG